MNDLGMDINPIKKGSEVIRKFGIIRGDSKALFGWKLKALCL